MSSNRDVQRLDKVVANDFVPGLDLNLLMLFREIMSSGSITQAALRLRTARATLSRKRRALVQQVGAVLVKGGAQRLNTTENR